ncbi:GNAT family N-acetyltransferase [Streptomyces coeruleorubidus]|uniref:GNAT family N-acetyltransferase n=1 Tax=Streptomyces coeruleorubidus TaxID=116188 RepID=UPI0033FD6403
MAALLWEWLVENGGEALGEHEEFVRHFVDWARDNAVSHRCMVVVRDDDGVVIGMARLAVVQRVPTPRAPRRASGDLGLERVTVHSSRRAIPAYARCGFQESPRLLQDRVAGA